MKKILVILLMLMLLISSGCSIFPNGSEKAAYITSLYFGYDENKSNYYVEFAFYDDKENYIVTNGNAEVKIVDDNGLERYSKKHSFKKSDFFTFYNEQTGKQERIVRIYIPESDLATGTTPNGKVSLNVECGASFFDTYFEDFNQTVQILPYELETEYISDLSFSYNADNNGYYVQFCFYDVDKNYKKINGTVNINIVDDKGDVRYNKEHSFTENDYYTYLGVPIVALFIPQSEVGMGKTVNGRVRLDVVSGDLYWEDYGTNVQNLPVDDVSVYAPSLPVEVKVMTMMIMGESELQSKLKITGVKYGIDNSDEPCLLLQAEGEKTYSNNGIDAIDRVPDGFMIKLCDKDGFVIYTEAVYLSGIAKGDKFRSDIISIPLSEIDPSEEYTVRVSELESEAW